MLDALAAQQRPGETSLSVRIEPDLIQDAMNVPGLQKAIRSRIVCTAVRAATQLLREHHSLPFSE
jgi:hypothetical protein